MSKKTEGAIPIEMQEAVDRLNPFLLKLGMLEIAIVNPSKCLPQPRNARYFAPEVFRQLVDNIKVAGNLESVPLVYRHESREGYFFTTSGHHRIDAAKEAGLNWVMVFIFKPTSVDEITSKQLSHNALTGIDDPVVLAELFNSIEDLQAKIATGLTSEVGKIEYDSLNFKIGATKSMTLLFVPEELLDHLGRMDAIEEEISKIPVKGSEQTRLIGKADWNSFAALMRKIKKTENIKSNAVAFGWILSLAEAQLKSFKKGDKP